MTALSPSPRAPRLPVVARLSAAAAALTAEDTAPLREDDPARELWLGWIVILAFFGIFLGWAAFAHLDAAATAEGVITVSGHRQTIQHREGGVISVLHVHEGQHVEAGEVMVEMTPSEIQGSEKSLEDQLINLEALRARLMTEQGGHSQIPYPVEWASLEPEERSVAEDALKREQTELLARARSLSAQKAVMHQKEAQLNSQIAGINGQMESTEKQAKLINDELGATRGLADQGYAPINRLRALERNVASLSGSKADLSANVARSQQQIAEVRSQTLGMDSQRQEEVARDLQNVDQQISELTPRLLPLKQQVANATVRAPVSGSVVGLSAFFKGAVIQPGQRLMDIVPDAAPLIVEARLSPNDVADVTIGQETQVRLSALHDRSLPILKGKVTQISADSLTDERTGARFYAVEVTVPVNQVLALRKAEGRTAGLRPGLPAQVMIGLRKRTALEYLLEPLTQSMSGSLHEH